MEELNFIRTWLSAGQTQSPWQYLFALLAASIVFGPKLLSLRAEWADFVGGKRRTELERARLELMKLHYEIEAIRKQHGLDRLDIPELAPVVADSESPPSRRRVGSNAKAWLADHPRLARATLVLAQAVLGILVALSGFGILGGLSLFVDEPMTALILIGMYGLMAWALYLPFQLVKNLRREIALSTAPKDSTDDAAPSANGEVAVA